MAYTPLNQAIFQAAMAGAMSGMVGDAMGNGLSPAVAANYLVYASAAYAFAQSYDTNRGALPSGALENVATELICTSAWRNRNPTAVPLANTPATWTGLSADIFAAVTETVAVAAAGGSIVGVPGNRGFILDEATTNGQGVGGPTIVALVALKAQGSGVFRWSVGGEQAAAAATEVSTWTVTTQTGAGALTTTGGTAPGAANGFVANLGTILFASGVAGTGIAITGGGGSEQTLVSEATTIGTAAVGDKIGVSGLVYNAGAPFGQGSNVILLLKQTNSATNRVIASINMSLEEI